MKLRGILIWAKRAVSPFLQLLLSERVYEWLHIQCYHYYHFRKFAKLRHPNSISERVKYRMYWDRRSILTRLVDKIAARDYVAARGGSQYLSTLYAVTRNPATIDFAALPQSFVIKPSHTSEIYMLVPDKSTIDPIDAIHTCHQWLRGNRYYATCEYQYRHIVPHIMIEEYLTDDYLGADKDVEFRFFVFDGEPKYLHVNVFHHNIRYKSFYWPDWRRIPVKERGVLPYPHTIAAPARLDEMLALCRRLTTGIDFVRIDLKIIDGRILFREFTFAAGDSAGYLPRSYGLLFGSFWQLPDRRILQNRLSMSSEASQWPV